MILVGLTGAIGHGKTTFANYLAACSRTHRHLEASDLVIEVANALRSAAPEHPSPADYPAITDWLKSLPPILKQSTHVGTSPAQFKVTPRAVRADPDNYDKLFQYLALMQAQPDRQQVLIDSANKAEFRALLQWLGVYLMKTVGPGIWFDEIVRRITAPGDTELATVGGLRFPDDAVRIRQAGGTIIRIIRPDYAEPDKHDPTERQRGLIKPDIVVMNDGSLDQLRSCSGRVFDDLKAGKSGNQLYSANNP